MLSSHCHAFRNARFPQSRFEARLKSWSSSSTSHGDPIKSYQILRPLVAIVLMIEIFLKVQKFSTINTIIFQSWLSHHIVM